MSAGEEEEDSDDGDDSFVINVNMDALSDVSEDAYISANVGNYGRIFHFGKHRRERLAQCHVPFGNGGSCTDVPMRKKCKYVVRVVGVDTSAYAGP